MDEINLFLKPDEDLELGPGDIDVGQPSSNELDIFDAETRRCSISCRASTIQPAERYINDSPSVLIILVFTLHPEKNCRFSYARISCGFKAPMKDDGSPATNIPRISFMAPLQTYGGHSQVDKSWTFGLEAPVQVPGGFFSIIPSLDRSVTRKVDHFMVINGSRRGNPPTRCVWTMEENSDNKSGLPLNFCTAVVLRAKETVELDLNITSKVVWQWFPRTMKSASEHPSRIVLTNPVGRQLPVKEDLDELNMETWFTGGLDGGVQKWSFEMPYT
jgi:hypothetical protein